MTAITDLHAHPLDAIQWGPKAANLGAFAMQGFPVPPGLCFAVSEDGGIDLGHAREALEPWLTLTKPGLVAVRSSLANEDGANTSSAGFGLTVLSIEAESHHITDRIAHVLRQTAQPDIRSVIVQSQVPAEHSGVAFTDGGSVYLESSAESTRAVTGGLKPEVSIRITDSAMEARGDLQRAPWQSLGHSVGRLARDCRRVQGAEVDIEWTWITGSVGLLQVRPVTARVEGW